MTAINTKANADKRHLESAVHTMHAEIDDMLHQAKNSEEKAKKAMVDAARLADELRSEQDHASSQEKAKRALEAQIAELDQRLAEVKHMICHNKTMNTYLGHYVNTKLSHLILQATKTFVLEHSGDNLTMPFSHVQDIVVNLPPIDVIKHFCGNCRFQQNYKVCCDYSTWFKCTAMLVLGKNLLQFAVYWDGPSLLFQLEGGLDYLNFSKTLTTTEKVILKMLQIFQMEPDLGSHSSYA